METSLITFHDLTPYLRNASSCAIAGHVRPDGDAIGSCTALYLFVKKNYPDLPVRLYLEAYPSCFQGLPGIADALSEYDGCAPDLLILSDVSTPDRVGVSDALLRDASFVINIDHHKSNPGIGNAWHVVPSASSASEVVYDLLPKACIDKEIAELLYLGILHDTGGFQYSSTTPKVLKTAADLLSFSFDAAALYDKTLNARSYKEMRIVGYALANASLFARGKAVISCLTQEELDAFSCTTIELSSIVSELRKTEGTVAAVFLYPVDDGYKASFRSKYGLDVSAIAARHGGGGHLMAAGCTLQCVPEDAAEMLIREVEEALLAGGFYERDLSAL